MMLARERRATADAAADGCTELAAALATLPSGLLEMVAEAVTALGCEGHFRQLPDRTRPDADVAPPSHTMPTVL